MKISPSIRCKSPLLFWGAAMLVGWVAGAGEARAQFGWANQPPHPVVYRQPIVLPEPVPVVPDVSDYLTFNGRFATSPSHLPAPVRAAVTAGNRIQGKPYIRGGGHVRVDDYGYDCSGAVSYLLIKSGLLGRPLTSAEFAGFGEPGPGRYINIFIKPGKHVFISVCGLRLDTSGGGRNEEGPRWRPTSRDAEEFIVRHPSGF